VAPGIGCGGWSTPEVLAVEERLVANALRRRQHAAAVVPADILEETLRAAMERLPAWAPTRSR
jgi:hypothetical protein